MFARFPIMLSMMTVALLAGLAASPAVASVPAAQPFRPQPVRLPGAAAIDDFSLAVVPGTVSVVAGHPAQLTVDTTTTTGAAQQVALRLLALPAGVFATVTPASVVSGESATLTVQTSVSVRAGTFTLTVEGAGPAVRHQASVRLVVKAPPVIRAAFYYPWFPEAWRQLGLDPYTNYRPSRGSYTVDQAVVREQVADMRYGGITVGIASWFGRGSTTDRHWPAMIGGARNTGFAWAPYYEPEGTANPTPDRIADDLHYLRTTYGGDRSSLAVLPGRGMPVFVYNAGDLTTDQGCDTVSRWNQARSILRQRFGEVIYLDLKVFPGYAGCPGSAAVDGWHQYGPARADADFSRAPGAGSYTISPGFWKAGLSYGEAPFLSRNLSRWQSGVARMNASGAPWQLITTYNEWGEGTSIESSSGCRGVAPSGTLCDWSGAGRSDFITELHAQLPPGSVVTAG